MPPCQPARPVPARTAAEGRRSARRWLRPACSTAPPGRSRPAVAASSYDLGRVVDRRPSKPFSSQERDEPVGGLDGRVALPAAADDEGAAGVMTAALGGASWRERGDVGCDESCGRLVRCRPRCGQLADLGVAAPDRGLGIGLVGRDLAERPCRRRRGRPHSTQAAWRAAPSATYSPAAGTETGAPSTVGAIRRTASDRAPPPISMTGRTSAPCATSASRPSARPQSSPSTAARAEVRRGGGRQPQAVQRAGRVGPVRGALALEVGHEDEAVGARRGGERELGQLVVVDAEHPRGRVEHPGGVERARRAAGSGRSRRRSRRRRRSGPPPATVGDRAHDARGADRHDDVARLGPEPERGGGVVARARAEHRAGRGGPAGSAGAERPAARTASCPSASRSRSSRYSPVGGRPVAGAARVAAVGDQRVERRCTPASRQVSQSCGRQTAATRAGVVGLVLGQPAQLGDRERRDRHRPDGLGPRGCPASPPPSSSIRSSAARAERVSFHSSAGRTTSPSSSRQHHAVLLPADGDGRDVVEAAGRRRPPAASACHQASGSTSVPSGCGARPCADERAGLGVADDDLARLRRASRPRRRAASGGPSARAEQVLDRELVERAKP